MDKKKITLIVILLIVCFFIGFSIPYIYENYGSVLKKQVMSNGKEEIENGTVIKEEQKEELDKEIDYNKTLKEAQDSFYRGNYEQSINKYIDLYDQGYDNIEVLKNLIFISDYSNINEKKIEDILKKAYQKEKDSLVFNYHYGKYLYEKGNLSSSKDILSHLFVLLDEKENILSDRKLALASYYLGDIYYKEEKNKVALDFFNRGIKFSEEIILNYLAAAKIYESRDLYYDAINMYEKTLKQDHSLSRLYYNLALLYEEEGELLKAYNYWDRCVNSGIKPDLARSRIKDIQQKHPKYFSKETIQDKKREIKWADIQSIEPNKKYPELKIGLQENIDRVRFQSKYDFTIRQNDKILFEGKKATQYQISFNNNTFYISQDDDIVKKIPTNQKLQIISEEDNNLFALYDIRYAQNYFWGGTENRQYRGEIYLNPSSNKYFSLLNYVDLTSYLLSVVPSEMPASWPQEALKAQSIVARSYVIKNLRRHQNEGYDLCASVHCIVYSGAISENPRTTKAVVETKNQVVTHQGQIIDAVFSSNSGGYTEASQHVWGNSFDYLKAVNIINDNEYQFPLSPYEIEDWFVEKPNSYSNNKYTTASSYRWVKDINLSDLKGRHNLSEIKRVVITSRTSTGTVKEIKIEGLNKTITVNDSSIRRALNGLKSNKFIVKNIYNDNSLNNLLIFGAGWGHSVGMDQTAAAGMAVDGKSYQDIIEFFYPDIKITNLD